jgi:pyruvate dehydrogenase E1 component alpha subunit
VQGVPRVAVAVFGDGATNIGAFHEALNLASVWRLPVVFLVDNNVYGEYSRWDVTTPVEDLHTRASAYAMASAVVDGMDVDACRDVLARAVERARTGGGPTLVEAKTYRFAGHSRADTARYRPEGELDHWRLRDPVPLTRQALLASGATEAAADTIEDGVRHDLAAAEAAARAQAPAGDSAIFRNVWTTVPGGVR